jgi:hypothetical protein
LLDFVGCPKLFKCQLKFLLIERRVCLLIELFEIDGGHFCSRFFNDFLAIPGGQITSHKMEIRALVSNRESFVSNIGSTQPVMTLTRMAESAPTVELIGGHAPVQVPTFMKPHSHLKSHRMPAGVARITPKRCLLKVEVRDKSTT